jgi:hypothetical protein
MAQFQVALALVQEHDDGIIAVDGMKELLRLSDDIRNCALSEIGIQLMDGREEMQQDTWTRCRPRKKAFDGLDTNKKQQQQQTMPIAFDYDYCLKVSINCYTKDGVNKNVVTTLAPKYCLDLFESSRASDSTTESGSTTSYGLGDEYMKLNQGAEHSTDKKTLGLVEWNVNVLKEALVKVFCNS